MRVSLVFFFTLITSLGLYAQDNARTKIVTGSIIGNVLDSKTGKPLAFANISLTSPKGSGALIADKNGSFLFDKLSVGYYRLSISQVGFAKWSLDSILLHLERFDINLGDIKLSDTVSSLGEVVIYTEKPLIENKDGKLTYNVSESPLSNGSNASEMLRNLPLMNANPDGTLLLRGKEPLILMDEKPVNLSGQQLSDLLESLPANIVEKVEIMVTPPPEYATYPGGVINIITKKGRVGIYEKLNLSYGTKGESSLSGNFNYRSSKLNISSSLGTGAAELRGNSWSHRKNVYKDSFNYFFTESAFVNRNKHPNARVQLDYDFTKKSSISLVYQGNLSAYENNSFVLYSNRDSALNVYKASSRTNGYEGDGYGHAFSGSYTWRGKNPVEKWQLFSGLNFNKNNNDRDFYQQFLQADFMPTGLDSTQTQLTDNFTRSFYVNTNYNRPLNDSGNIFVSLGSTYTNQSNHNILSTSFLRKTDRIYITNDLLSNNFYFHQIIFTTRASLIIGLKGNWRIVAGAQAEYTKADFAFIRGNAPDANNSYWRVLPNITLRKEFNRQFNVSLVFRETIRRPGLTELNPSIDYSDPYNIRFGNPLLLPSLTDNYDINFSYVQKKFNINGSLGYNRIKNVFNSIRTLSDSGKTQITFRNISDQQEYQASIWTGITVTRKFKINVSAGYHYNQYGEKEKLLYKYHDGGSFYTTFNYSYSPDNFTVIEANNRFASYATPQGQSRSNINMGLSLQRKFLNKRMVVGISAIDPLGLQVNNGSTYGTNFQIESHSISNTRNFRISVSYQLSKVMLKSNLDDKQKKGALEKLKQKG